MASISSININELLPGIEDFLRSMLHSSYLDSNHREIAAKYLDKIDQFSQSTIQQSSIIDDQSLMNTDFVSDDESDDFTDEEDELQKTENISICDNQLYNSFHQESNINNSQWYADLPQTLSERKEKSSSIIPRRLSSSTSSSSSIIADGLLLTYDKNHNWIWRYYVLDDFDLICFPSDKKSQLTIEGQTENNISPIWVSDMTNLKIHRTTVDRFECLCLQIGLSEMIYVRPADPNEIHFWFKIFQDAILSHKSKVKSKSQNNVKKFSRNARRIFAQFNRKKGQFVSHILDQMANVTGVDDKIRKHCELRGFLVISLDNSTYTTKYCTIVDGIFRIHKSRLSEQIEHEYDLNHCILTLSDERTRDIQFTLIDRQLDKIYIRGNNIYTMGRLLNSLAKYVEIKRCTEKPVHANKRSLSFNVYRNASKLHNDGTFVSPICSTEKVSTSIQQDVIYEQPKSYVNIKTTDRTNNHSLLSTSSKEKHQNQNDNSQSRGKSSPNLSSISSSPEQNIFCIRSKNLTASQRGLARRSSMDYLNRHMSDSMTKINLIDNNMPSISSCFYDFSEKNQSKSKLNLSLDENEYDETYDNLPNSSGVGKFRFVVPFNHSPRSAFTRIKSTSSTTIDTNSTFFPTPHSSNNRARLMTAV